MQIYEQEETPISLSHGNAKPTFVDFPQFSFDTFPEIKEELPLDLKERLRRFSSEAPFILTFGTMLFLANSLDQIKDKRLNPTTLHQEYSLIFFLAEKLNTSPEAMALLLQ